METESRIRRFIAIQRLPRAAQDRAVAMARVESVRRGQALFEQGSSDLRIHYLVAGTIELVRNGKVVRTLSSTNQAALRPLDPSARKGYAARVIEDAIFVWFPRAALDRLIEQCEAAGENGEFQVSDITSARSSDWMIRMLQSPLFAELPATNIQKIFARMEPVTCHEDDVIVTQGATGDYYYVIEKGYCEVARTISGGRGQIHLADLGPGSCFGEEALISSQPRNASVTMLSDGQLMRLAKDDFVELILNEVLRPITLERALIEIEQGAAWLDIRYPEDHALRGLRDSENIPLNMLRLQCNRLREGRRYVICGDDPAQCAIAAFLLGERGIDSVYATDSVAALIAARPELAALPPAHTPTVVLLAGQASQVNGRQAAQANIDDDPLDKTIDPLASLSARQVVDADMMDTLPLDRYADTASGHALADLIDEIEEPEAEISMQPDTSLSDIMVARSGTAEPQLAPRDEDGIATLFREMERRVRADAERAVRERSARIEAEYQVRFERLREHTDAEIRAHQHALRSRVQEEYTRKEQLLRGYYKKVIVLARDITRQKAQLQQAQRHFERKLHSTSQLYREVSEVRQILIQQIDHLEAEQVDEIPPLSVSF